MKREEAIAILTETQVFYFAPKGKEKTQEALDMAIEALQTELVRCKDCRHRYEEGDCTHYYWCRLNDRPIDDTDFCAWGERKGGDTE